MRHATLKQLRGFAAVIAKGSISGAAQYLNVTPSAVTLQMQLLQDQAGIPLIERAPSGMIPTEAGREVLAAVERIEAALADCQATLAAMAGTEQGTVTVGVISTAKYFAPAALAAFARTHPGIELKLVIGNREEMIEGLSHYAVDVAIMGRPPGEVSVKASVIGDHPHLIVAPPHHPLAHERNIDPSVLASETFLERERGSGTLAVMERFMAGAGISPKIGMQISSNETIKQAVIAGLGIALISGHTVEAELESGRLIALDVKGLPIVRQWHVVRLRDRRLLPAAQAILRFLTEEAINYLPVLRGIHMS